MTPAEFRAELKRLGLTQKATARFLDVGDRTLRRWAAGDPIPKAAAMLLRRLTPEEVKSYSTQLK